MDIVRMIKLYAVWMVIVAYLKNIKYKFFPQYPEKIVIR